MAAVVVLLGFLAAAGVGHAFQVPAEDICAVAAMSHDMAGEPSTGCDKAVTHDSCLSHVSCSFYIEPDVLIGWLPPAVVDGAGQAVTVITGLTPPPDTPPPIAFF